MKNFSTWLLAIFMVMFWLFRAIVALCTQYSVDMLGIVAYNLNIEIIIAFLTIPCIVLVIRRKLVGSLAYLLILLYNNEKSMNFYKFIIMHKCPQVRILGAFRL